MRTIANLKSLVVRHLAGRYIAGPDLADAVAVARRTAARGWQTTLCRWDDPEDSAQSVAASYRQAAGAIASEQLDSYLSVKVPSLHYDLDLLGEVLEAARPAGIRIHFDSHDPLSATPTFRLLERALPRYPNLSCTLPSRWRRSLADAEWAIELGIPVRLVKGQFPDAPGAECDPAQGFLQLVDALAGRRSHVAVATHDQPLARESLRRLRQAGTSCELEQLYGIRHGWEGVARPFGVGMRLYIAFGHAWLPYCLSQIRSRPIILAWLLHDLFRA